MPELRWDPVLEEWVVIATKRIARPLLPKNTCPFCPGVLEVPKDYEIVCFENMFPSFEQNPDEPSVEGDELSPVLPAKGICEVILYTPEHDTTLTQQSIPHIRKLVEVWSDRYRELGEYDFIDYVYIFENKGEVIGVTLTHPHGQIYAFSYIPPKAQRELNSSEKYMREKDRCLFCDILSKERKDGRRMVAENQSFSAFVPFFAHWSYEIHIYPHRHLGSLLDFTEEEKDDFAKILKVILVKYDNLFGFSLPYMMLMHQIPTDGLDYSYYHFHMEFYPLHRGPNKLKYLAGCESGAGTFINDNAPEEKAQELREADPKTKGEER